MLTFYPDVILTKKRSFNSCTNIIQLQDIDICNVYVVFATVNTFYILQEKSYNVTYTALISTVTCITFC